MQRWRRGLLCLLLPVGLACAPVAVDPSLERACGAGECGERYHQRVLMVGLLPSLGPHFYRTNAEPEETFVDSAGGAFLALLSVGSLTVFSWLTHWSAPWDWRWQKLARGAEGLSCSLQLVGYCKHEMRWAIRPAPARTVSR